VQNSSQKGTNPVTPRHMNMSTTPTPRSTQDVLADTDGFVGPTFSLGNRLKRVAWQITWTLLARWTPPPARPWRIALLRLFGARVSWQANVYGSAKVWAPWHLEMAEFATLGPHVTAYNIGMIRLDAKVVVSQGAHLCTGTHDHRDPAFPLYAKPIVLEKLTWVCAGAFIGPGVTMREGSVLAAHGVAFKSLDAWTVYVGNPAQAASSRTIGNG
jgi:putative colanic acid biosynthesis acetyltransferase WcaF